MTFTATVGTIAPGIGTPTGTVTFYDGTTALGRGLLGSDGTATFATSTLDLGPHSITAAYQGDANFMASTSTSVNHRVFNLTVTTAEDVVDPDDGLLSLRDADHPGQ